MTTNLGRMAILLAALVGACGRSPCRRAGAVLRQGAAALVSAASTPLISRNVPAFASDDCTPASYANDGDYSTQWTSCGAPSSSAPAWIAYDLASVPAANRTTLLVAWYNDPATSDYDWVYAGNVAYDLPDTYTIEAHADTGAGTPPAQGWVALATVTGNKLHSRQHLLNFADAAATPFRWLKMSTTVVAGPNPNVSFNLDVHDASGGTDDDYIFFGDSITEAALNHDPMVGACPTPCPYGGPGVLGQLVNQSAPGHFPVQENGGIGGTASADGAAMVGTWIQSFPGKYVGLSYGTNDANGGCDSTCAQAFHDNYVKMLQAVLAGGKIPLVPTVPWARTPGVSSGAPLLNQQIQKLYQEFPQIIPGPDLYGFFFQHQDLISSDDLHPSDEGMLALRNQWASTLLQRVYKGSTASAGSSGGDAGTGSGDGGTPIPVDSCLP